MKVEPTRSGADHLEPGRTVKVVVGGAVQSLAIAAARPRRMQVLVRFDGADAAVAAGLVGAELFAQRGEVALAAGEYFDDDLVGCTVVDARGGELGAVTEVLHYPGQDLLAVGRRRALIPLVAAFIRKIDVAGRRIDVDLPEGLLD